MATAPTPTPAAEFRQPTNGSRIGEPVWDIALWYPPQGLWSEDEYLSLGTDWPVEFVKGVLEFLPMPTFLHRLIIVYLHERLKEFINRKYTLLAWQVPHRVRW